MDTLPEDLLVLVLCRLDRCSLLASKQACCEWRDAVCGPKLVRARAQMGVQGTAFIVLVDQATEDPDPPLAEDPSLHHPPIRLSFYDVSLNRWRQIEPPNPSSTRLHPGRRSGFCCASIEGEVYLVGGRCWQWDPLLSSWAWKASASGFCYSPLSNAWRPLRPMGEPRANFACATIGGKLYVAGGCARVLDPIGGAARVACRWGGEEGGGGESGGEARPGEKWVACGYDGFGNRFGRQIPAAKEEWGDAPALKQVQALDSAELYDPDLDEWAPVARMPGGVQFPDQDSCQGAALGGQFVVLGTGFGLDSEQRSKEEEASCDVLAYQPESDRWQVLGCGPGCDYRRGYGSAVVCGHVVVFGGLSKLKPEWGRDGQLLLPKQAPGIYSALDALVGDGEELDPRLATLPPLCRSPSRSPSPAPEQGKGRGRWVRVGEYQAPDAIPKLSPACVAWGCQLYVVGSQERKMGAWEVYGLWRQPQPMWRFDAREGRGGEEGGGRWRQMARTPYAPVKPKLVKVEW